MKLRIGKPEQHLLGFILILTATYFLLQSSMRLPDFRTYFGALLFIVGAYALLKD